MGIHRFLYNAENKLLEATIAASGVRPALNSVRSTAVARRGTGRVHLEAPTGYTGTEDTTVDIEIAETSGVALAAGDPVFVGVGNPEIGNIAASGLNAQTVTVEMISTGTRDAYASVAFFGVVLRALQTGTSGNAIRLRISPVITRTATAFSLLGPLGEKAERLKGQNWDFGAFPLDAEGRLNPGTQRIVIGEDPQVFRQYKKWVDSEWCYSFSPAPPRSIPAGTPVYAVTGSYTVTIGNGTIIETYPGIVTLYEFLAAVQARPSALIEIVGVVSNDTTPGGMAAVDMPLRTAPYALAMTAEGSSYVKAVAQSELALTLDSASPTEDVRLECVANDSVGRELWKVSGPISGERSLRAVSGTPYNDPRGFTGFRIPRKVPAVDECLVTWEVQYIARALEEVSPPPICLGEITLGASARPMTVTLEYRLKPVTTGDCGCEGTSYEGHVSRECLGIIEEIQYEGGNRIVQQSVKQRYEAMLKWYHEFVVANTSLIDGTGGVPLDYFTAAYTAVLEVDRIDIYTAEQIRHLFIKCLSEIDEFNGNEPATWAAGESVAVGNLREPSTPNDHYYKALNAGTTDETEPEVWDTSWGVTIDNGIRWLDMGKKPVALFDELFSSMVLDMAPLETLNGGAWWKVVGPSAPFIRPWTATTSFSPGMYVTPTVYNGFYAVCSDVISTNWETDTEEPMWQETEGATVRDRTIIWTMRRFADLISAEMAEADTDAMRVRVGYWLKRYDPQVDRITAAAEIVPPFRLASEGETSEDSGSCWQDEEDELYQWNVTVSGGNNQNYKPAFTNVPWVSCVEQVGTDGIHRIACTKELGFVVKVKPECIQYLKTGDRIRIVVSGALKSYQVGDRITIPVINAAPLSLTGGQNGNGRHVWRVNGSDFGPFADYEHILSAPVGYSDGGLSFNMAYRGIPPALGDRFQFALFSGSFRWRQDEGAWSEDIVMDPEGSALTAGLHVTFSIGETGFVPGDTFRFLAEQVNALSHLSIPDWQCWQWTGATPQLQADLSRISTIRCVALWHELPAGTTITLKGSDDAWETDKFEHALVWAENLIVAFFEPEDDDHNIDSIRLVLAGADGGAIKYLWIGDPFEITMDAQSVRLNRTYRTYDGVYGGHGGGGEISWGNNPLTASDLSKLQQMIDYVKINDQPIVFVPHYLHPDKARMVELATDRIEIRDFFNFEPDVEYEHHRYGMDLPLEAVIE